MIGDRFVRIARVASVIAIIVGCCGLFGWIFDVAILKSVLPGLTAMALNTAVSFVLAGVCLWLQIGASSAPRRTWPARACALVVLTAGALTLVGYLLGTESDVDPFSLRALADEIGASNPGRMAPNSALSFVFMGTALVLFENRIGVLRATSQALVIAVLLSAFVALAGYLYNVTALYGVSGYTSMALPTAIGFAVLSIGVLASRPRRGLVAILAQDNPGGAAIRRLLPLLVATPLAVGWLRLKGQQAGFYGTEFGLALMVTVSTIVLVSLALWNARAEGVSDRNREQALRDEHRLFEIGEILRSSADSAEVLFQVAKNVGEYLGASRCLFIEIDIANDRATVHRDYCDGLPPLAGMLSPSSFSPESFAKASAGRTLISSDTSTDKQTAQQYEQAYRPVGIRARVAVPLLRDGLYVSTFLVSTHEPRVWQAREVTLIQSVTERTWLWFEHLRALEALRKGEARRIAVLNSAFDAIVWMDHAGLLVEFNPAAERLFGYRRSDVIGKPMAELLIPPSLRDAYRHGFARYLETGEGPFLGKVVELPALRADGSEFAAELALNRVVDQTPPLFTAFVRDVTERKKIKEQLRTMNCELEARVETRTSELNAALKEREVLLQEVHHRVKNNLQVISSLINMQVQPMAEGSSRSALEECKTRVEAIALIHEKLYQSRDYAQIPFAEYARGLATNIFRSTGVSSARITLGLEIEDISLPVDQAIPCGLILNELITNALKHAFPEDRTGTVRVELRKPHACEMLLAVFDDGVGMAPGLSFNGSSTLGMELVSTLVNQLEGRLEIDRGHGTAFRITFPLEDISAMNGPSAVA